MSALLHDPGFWVTCSFVLFVALVYKKAAVELLGALDKRSAKIKADLDQARALREEAEAVLADYKRKQADYLKEAEAMLAEARVQADALSKQAEINAKALLDDRMRQAVEKIAQEEEKAIAEVRNHVVDIALGAAHALIVEHMSNLSNDELVKLAVADIDRKIH